MGVFAVVLIAALTLADPRTPPSSEYQLKHVIVVHRHGDRTPIHSLPDDMFLFEGYWKSLLSGKARSHIRRMAKEMKINDAGDWHSQLTPVGLNQMRKLGQQLRLHYATERNLLSDTFNPNQVTAITTATTRTLESVKNLLSGLFPSADVNRIPVTVNDIFRPFQSKNKIHLSYSGHAKSERRALESRIHQAVAWTTAALNIYSPVTLDALSDTLMCRSHHHLPIPLMVTPHVVTHLLQLHLEDQLFPLRFDPEGAYHKAEYVPVFENLLQHIQNGFQNSDSKMTFISAHDTTLSLLLEAAFGKKMIDYPRYASALELLLWESPQSKVVTIVFNGKSVDVEACKLQRSGDLENGCDLDVFKSLGMN
eukprot:c6835_g1_i1.p1 GENE.c6835_g1_i1~~c6835_g1_i1.p1  ORF type:complete len:366 (-),score=91.21 c6835_g1_i1:18-1115(-)